MLYIIDTIWLFQDLLLWANSFVCQILNKNRRLMEAVVDALVQKRSLYKQEFINVVELHGVIKPTPPKYTWFEGYKTCTDEIGDNEAQGRT